MTFNSWAFLIFFPLVTLLYFVTPHRLRWLLLLVASCVFYMAFVPAYILILLFTIVIDYVAGICIEQARGHRRRMFLVMSLLANVGVLAVFKYGNFAIDNAGAVAQMLHLHYPLAVVRILLPIGLSFHTFQAMSYTIEVYRGNQRAERHFGIYALYVMFYPQLVAGPIERPQNLLHQFYERHDFDGDRVADGLGRMLWGMLKKIVIADRMALIVNAAYDRPHSQSALVLLIGTYCFAIQIYTDFSAYSDIALGAARVMGFTLMENFDRPYLSESVVEFWRRWHISLSTWFRDYVYIPLGGNRMSKPRWFFNLMVVFLVSGLWHGANWTFVVWGALHGFYVICSILTRPLRERVTGAIGLSRVPWLHRLLRRCITFNLVCITWIFFRAASVSEAAYIFQRICAGAVNGAQHAASVGRMLANLSVGPIGRPYLVLTLYLLLVAGVIHIFRRRGSITRSLEKLPLWVQWPAYYAMVFAILLAGTFGSQSFIYFQF